MRKNDIAKEVKGKRILITGGTGSIGGAIVLRLLDFQPSMIRVFARDEYKHYLLQKELELRDFDTRIEHFFGDVARRVDVGAAMQDIDVVIHAAGMKHVRFCEDSPAAAFRTNVVGAQNVIDQACIHAVKKVVAVSTDKAVNPESVMGRTKLRMEKIMLATPRQSGSITLSAITRFGNVTYSRGSVLPYWEDRAAKGLPIFLHDPKMRRYFMSIDEAVDSVLYTLSKMRGGEIFIRRMKEKKMIDMARNIINDASPHTSSQIVVTGAGAGEKLTEQLYTEEEKSRLTTDGKFYVLNPHT